MQDPSTPADTRLKRFARNFRNTGVVKDYEIDSDTQVVTAWVDERGFNPSNVRAKGWEFDLVESHIDLTKYGEAVMVLVFELND